MGRTYRQVSTEYPYHVTARCINKEWFSLPLEQVWGIFCDYLYITKFGFEINIHSFVLMNNHFHLILSTPKGNLSQAMHYLMMTTGKTISKEAGRINQTFGGPYFSSIMKNHHYYLHAYKYVYRNPIDAKICSRADLYPYSTLSGKLGQHRLSIPICNDDTLFNDVEGTLSWIQKDYKMNDRDLIKKALSYREFYFAKDRSSRQNCHLELEIS